MCWACHDTQPKRHIHWQNKTNVHRAAWHLTQGYPAPFPVSKVAVAHPAIIEMIQALYSISSSWLHSPMIFQVLHETDSDS